jgi:polyhydroxybutyrate depolymerase
MMSDLTKYLLLSICMLASFNCGSRHARGGSDPDHPGQDAGSGISPGPSGRLAGKDHRVPLTWLEKPGAALGAGNYGRRLVQGEHKRYYEVHVPPGYSPGKAAPVVLVLHGGSGFATLMRFITHMDEVSDQEGFLVVYPAGTSPQYDDRMLFWNTGRPMRNKDQEAVDDVAFIATVLDDLASFFTVDEKRVYATGISNGGAMSYRLAAELSERIAAIAPVAGQMAVGEFKVTPKRPVSVMHFAGKLDPHNPYEGGSSETVRGAFEPHALKPVPEVIDSWVKQNGCSPQPAEKRVGKAHSLTYTGCKEGAEVVLWVLEDAGHTWPGGEVTRLDEKAESGEVNRDVDASRTMWEFFQRHSR